MMSVVVANFNRAVWMLFNIMPRSGLLKGKGSPGWGLFFGGSMKLLWVYLVMFILLAVSIVSHAAECQWTTCGVVDSSPTCCFDYGEGTVKEMQSAAGKPRGRGQLFTSECVKPGEKPVVKWENKRCPIPGISL